MKRMSIIFLLIFIGCKRKQHPCSPLPSLLTIPPIINPGKRAVIAIMGQSNVLGAGMDGEYASVDGVITDMPRRGPGYPMAVNLVSTLGPIKLLTCAVGGTDMERWSIYGDLYRGCVSYLQSQIQSDEYLAVVVFDQGESDAVKDLPYPWAEHFTASMRDLRTHYQNIPIVYVQLGAHTTPEEWIPNWVHIQQEQASVMLPSCSMVTTFNLDVIGMHYTEAGYLELGHKLAQAFINLGLDK